MYFSLTSAARTALWAAILMLTALTGPTVIWAQQGVLVPGRAVGDIKFQNPSPPLLNQCASDPAVAPTLVTNPVVLRSLLDGSSALGAYSTVNQPVGSDFTLGSFDINPNVMGSGSNFLIYTDSIQFQSGATYRFGSYYPAGVGARFCSGVLPITANPAGTKCDQAECAVLLNVKFRFVGTPADLGALDTGTLAPPAVCSVKADIFEPSTSIYVTQAKSANFNFSIADLIAGYKSIPLLVRGNTTEQVIASCKAAVTSGATGFVILPGTNLTPLSSGQSFTPSCALSGTPSAPLDVTIDISVARTAGTIQGLLDLNGHVEENAQVQIGPPGSPFIAGAQVDAANPAGPLKWKLDGVPSGEQPVTASTLADQRDKFVIFPARDGLNTRVAITPGSSTDLGATFVARPKELEGQVTVFDFGQADLSTLVISPFAAYENFYSKTTSYAEAVGSPSLPQAGGASGIGGTSRGRLQGAYNTATSQAVLNYDLLLPGIGLPSSSPDGSGAQNTTWDFTGLQLKMKPTTTTDETLTIAPGTLLRTDTGSPPATIPDVATPQSYCFGRVNVDVKVDPTLGSLFQPYASMASTTNYEPVATGTTPVGSVTGSTSVSIPFSQRTPTVSLSSTLVAGVGYRVLPAVRFAPAGATSESQSTYTTIPPINVPVQGVIACASPYDICISQGGPSGPSNSLSVDILDPSGIATPSYCLASGPATFIVNVNSSNPTNVQYELDPAAAGCSSANSHVLCSGSCNPNPQFTVSFASLLPGTHTLRVCASDVYTCSVSEDFNFQIQSQSLGISCPSPISITLNEGETSLPSSDPRIAGLLHATVAGTCGIPPAVANNAPSSFPIGTTSVTFSAPDVGSCVTSVTVNPARGRQLAVGTTHSGIQTLDIYKLSSPFAALEQNITVGTGFAYDFSPNGDKVAVATYSGSTGIVDLSTGASAIDFTGTNTVATSLNSQLIVAWHNSGKVYAVLGRGSTNRPTIQVVGTSAGASPNLMQTVHPPLPNGFDLTQLQLPTISFSNDGSRLVIAGSGAFHSGYRNIALTARTNPNGMIIPGSWQTAMTEIVDAEYREEIHEIAFRSSTTEIATNRNVYTLNAAGTNWVFVRARNNVGSAFGGSGRILALTESAPSTTLRVVLMDIASGTANNGPTYSYGSQKGEVALSVDANRIAVLDRQGVRVYDKSFNQISQILDPSAGKMRFRPGN